LRAQAFYPSLDWYVCSKMGWQTNWY